jgi:AraC family transcriptional regulator of adaptative response / DNA-3-methyladenine glycosylase II
VSKHGETISSELGYQQPYRWDAILKFFAGRAIAGVEIVKDDAYFRTVRIAHDEGQLLHGWLKVSNNPDKCTLTITANNALNPALPKILSQVERQFDLLCDPKEVYDKLSVMDEIRPDLCKIGTRVPGCFDAFEMSVRAVLGQQITVKAAGTLAARIARSFGMPLQTHIEELTHTFPSPEDILNLGDDIVERFGEHGVISARSRTIQELARCFKKNDIDFTTCTNPEKEIEKLSKIRGIGRWTANYIAMRAMGFKDAFLETDYGVKKALRCDNPKQILALAEKWRPWRSYATVNLWNSL